jgi:hypothetical protein
MNIKQGIELNQVQEVLDFSFTFFENVISRRGFDYYMRDLANANWKKSALLLGDDNNIKGVYILGNHQLPSQYVQAKYVGLIGIEGLLIAVDESVRGQGWGNVLKDYPKTLGYGYIWGQQFKGLNNLKDWLKRRELIATTSEVYITAEIFLK